MKARLFVVFVLAVGLALLLTLAIAAQWSEAFLLHAAIIPPLQAGEDSAGGATGLASGPSPHRGSTSPIAVAEPTQVAPMTITLSVPGPIISGSVIITATVSDQIAAAKAVLLLDETPRGVSTVSPFTWDWVTTFVANGQHNLAVKAYNATGTWVAAGEISITVNNAVTPTQWMQAGLSRWQVWDVKTSLHSPGVAYAVVNTAVYKTIDWGAFWGSVGQNLPAGASFRCLAVDPSNAQDIFLGTSSGVYASQDGGETWQLRGLAQNIKDIAVGGTDGEWVYAISEMNVVYRSSDHGNTWIAAIENVGLLSTLSVDPLDGQVAFVGGGDPWTVNATVRKTLDGGVHWHTTVIGDLGQVTSIGPINRINRQTMYLGVIWQNGGLYKSTDAGTSWQKMLNYGILSLAIAPSDEKVVYAEEQWAGPLFLTLDGGQHWENARGNLPSGTSICKLAVDCVSPAIVYAATANGGLWSAVYTARNPVPLVTSVWPRAAYNDCASTITITGTNFLPTPDVMLNGTPLLDVTFVSSTTITATVPAGLPPGCYDLTVFNPSGQIGYLPNSITLITRTQIEITEPQDSSVISGSIVICAVPGQGNGIQRVELYLDNVLHASSVISPCTWIWASISTDNGAHAIQAKAYDLAGGIATSPVVQVVVNNSVKTEWRRWAFAGETIEDIETVPTTGIIWNLTANALYRSIDYGVTWNRSDRGLPSGIRFVAVGPNSVPSATIYAATMREVFVSRDAGESWTLDTRFASNLVYLDLVDDTPCAATNGQVFRRLQTGEWQPVGGALDALVYDMASYRSSLYVGTSKGLYRLTANVWQPIGVDPYAHPHYTPASWFDYGLKPRSMPPVESVLSSISVSSIVVLDGRMYLGTSGGRGVYRSDDGESWLACDVGLTGPYGHSVGKLVATGRGWLFAATPDGVFVSQNQADRWQALDAGLPHTITGYGVLLDNVVATSLALVLEADGEQTLSAVFNREGVWRLVVTSDMLIHDLQPQTPPKAVLIVGPVDPPTHTATLSNIAWANRLAAIMETHGMEVAKVYWPDSTWDNVRSAISGASIIVYTGHGFGLGDLPEDPTDMVGGCNGFCLVSPMDPLGARLGTQDMLIATSQLADNAIAFLFCCSCGGTSGADPVPVSEALARRRIEAYSSTFLSMGADGYFASVDMESILEDFFAHPNRTLGELYQSHGGAPGHTYTHILWPDRVVWFDGDTQHGWGRAFVGNPDLIAMRVLYVPVEGTTINGPMTGIVQTGYNFTATVQPITATLPITYVWRATGQLPVTHTGGLSDTVTFAWSMPGTKIITVTTTNPGSAVTTTHVININSPPTSVAISGPVMGIIQTDYTFIATVSPITTTLPITYAWWATEQSSVTRSGGLSDTIAFTWNTPGFQAITVTATNSWGTVTGTHVVTIGIPKLYLPLIMRNHQ